MMEHLEYVEEVIRRDFLEATNVTQSSFGSRFSCRSKFT